MPIRLRLAVLFATAVALLIGVGGSIFAHELASGLRTSLVAELQTSANNVSQNLSDQTGPNHQDPGGAAAGSGQMGGGSGQMEGGALLSQLLTPAGKVLDASGPGAARALLSSAQLARGSRGQLVLQRTFHPYEGPLLILAKPAGDQSGLVVVVATPLATLDEAVHKVLIALAVGGPIAVFLAAVGAWLLAGAALAPVERMRRQAAMISEHDRGSSLAVPGTKDELASLAQTLNNLLARLQGALNRQRGFVASAGHELRTPLAILRVELELATRHGRTKEELSSAVESAAEETEHLVKLAESLLALAGVDECPTSLALVEQDAVALVSRSLERFGQRASAKGVELRLDAPSEQLVPLDEVRLRQVVDNLIDNSLRFAPTGTEVEVTVRGDVRTVSIAVGDRGPGFPPEFLGHAFERFSRPDGVRARDHGGAGLGLAIVAAMVDAHHGVVTASNRPGGGAEVCVVLPLRPETPALPAQRFRRRFASRHSNRT